MRRLALAVSTLLLIIAGLSVVLVSASSGKSRPAAPQPIAVQAPALPKLAAKPLKLLPGFTARMPVPATPLLPLSRLGPARPPALRSAQLPFLVRPPALPRGVRPLIQPYGACYVGLSQCSVHGCAQYVAPVAQPAISAPAVDSALRAVTVAPPPGVQPRSTHCIASPAPKTVPATAPIITASPAGPTVTTPVPAKP